MSSIMTRRGLVAAAPAAIVAASLPAIGVDATPDAALLALREPYERTLAALTAVSADQTAGEKAFDEAVDANTDVLDQITATPAHTFQGLLFKARACAKADYESDLAASIVADLVAMGGADA